MAKKYLNPSTLFPSEKYGFSQIVTTQGGRTVYLSGQAAFDVAENIIGTNHQEQMQQCLKNIQAGLKAVGGSLDDVVSLRIYVVGYNPDAESDPVAEGLKKYFKGDRLPAATLIGVSTLAVRDFLVEIEATAVLE